MVTVFDPVHALTPKRRNWRICVRLVRKWNMPARHGHGDASSIELVMQDIHGDRVHASVRSGFVHRHKKHLEEGAVVELSNFVMVPATGSYRPTEHPYRVNFQFSTIVQPHKDDHSISRYGFAFKNFSDILSSDLDDRFLFDVVGRVSAMGQLEESTVQGRRQRRVDIELANEDLERLQCTLWGEFADDLLSYMASHKSGPVVIILQWCKAREFNHRNKISNSMYTSRLLIHPELTEVVDFIKKFEVAGVDVSQPPDRITPKGALTLAEELLGNPDRRLIQGLRKGPANKTPVVLAEIVDVRYEHGWFYNSCKVDGKKVIPDGDGFFCEKCNGIVKNVIPRFMVKFEAMDETGTCMFVLFDREFSKLASCSAMEMIDRVIHQPIHHDDEIENDNGLPTDVVDKIVGKKFLCMLRIPKEYVDGSSNSCIVTRLTSDLQIIEAFEAKQDAPTGSPTIVSSSHEDDPDVNMSLDFDSASSSVITGEKQGVKVKIEKADSAADDDDECLANYVVSTSDKPKREDKAVKVSKTKKKHKFVNDD